MSSCCGQACGFGREAPVTQRVRPRQVETDQIADFVVSVVEVRAVHAIILTHVEMFGPQCGRPLPK
jgi:hypothetical protein